MKFAVNTRIHRGGVVVAAVLACIFSLVVAAAPGAQAADTITFRAAAQAAWNQTTAPGDDPGRGAGDRRDAAVRHDQQERRTSPRRRPGGRWRAPGSSSTDTETTLYSKVAVANDAGRNAAVTFSATTKSTLTLLAYDGTAADPVAAFASAAETTNRATHTTPGANVATAGSYVVSYWADKNGSAATTGVDPARRPDPAQHHRRHRHRPHRRRRLRHQRAGRRRRQPGPHRHQRRRPAPRRRCGPSCSRPTRAPTRTCRRWRRSPRTAPPRPARSTPPRSTDTAPGTVASYAWNFGDGGTGTGVTTTHTYTTSGSKTITLTVTDNQGLTGTDHAHGQRDRRRRRGSGIDQPVPGPHPPGAGQAAQQHPADQQRRDLGHRGRPAAEPGLHRRQLHLDRQHDQPHDHDQPGRPGSATTSTPV